MAGVPYKFDNDGQLQGADPVLQQRALWATLVGLRHKLDSTSTSIFAQHKCLSRRVRPSWLLALQVLVLACMQ